MKAYREACGWMFRAQRPKDWVVGPVEIEVEYRHSKNAAGYKPRDSQNAISSLKAAVDSMIDAKVIQNDSNRWLTWARFQLFTRTEDGKPDGVYFHVRRV